jgi:hypothetical protein
MSSDFILNMRAFWDLASCSLVRSIDSLLNVSLLQQDHTALYPRRHSSLYSSPWEPEISQMLLYLSTIVDNLNTLNDWHGLYQLLLH